MKVVAFNGSPRKNSNTRAAIEIVLEELRKENIETELIDIGGRPLRGCIACLKCRKSGKYHCFLPDDGINEYIQKILQANGLIIGSPVYFSNVTSEVKAFIDRVGYATTDTDGNSLKNKVGAAVVCGRKAGLNFALAAINYFFGIKQMPIASSNFWNVSLSGDEGTLIYDKQGVQTFQKLGQNMAFLLKRINS
jgi:multimeric flavodoxin WrbA